MLHNEIICGDALEKLKELPNESVDCCVTSPPYWGLRDYGVEGQIGLEKTPEKYVAKMVEVFREVKRVLKKEGTFWLNLGDTYSAQRWTGTGKGQPMNKMKDGHRDINPERASGLPDKNLVGIPWRVAFALQADGWILRQDIIWSKPNPMPESVRDRCTKAHEYIFLLTRSPKYYYDAGAIKTPLKNASIARLAQDIESQKGSDRVPGKTNGPMKAVKFGGSKASGYGDRRKSGKEWHLSTSGAFANKKSVWEVSTKPFREAHFATFPPELIISMVKAGCPQGGIVLDPFMGSGTTALVARSCGRNYLGIELLTDYVKMAEKRLAQRVLV